MLTNFFFISESIRQRSLKTPNHKFKVNMHVFSNCTNMALIVKTWFIAHSNHDIFSDIESNVFTLEIQIYTIKTKI